MNLKYTGGVIGLVGFISGPFFILGTTGSPDIVLQGVGLGLFALGVVLGLVGSILSLRGSTKIGGPITLAAGLGLIALGFIAGKPTPYFTGGIMTVGGLLAFLYKEPVMTGGQWRMRRTGTGTGTPPASTS